MQYTYRRRNLLRELAVEGPRLIIAADSPTFPQRREREGCSEVGERAERVSKRTREELSTYGVCVWDKASCGTTVEARITEGAWGCSTLTDDEICFVNSLLRDHVL